MTALPLPTPPMGARPSLPDVRDRAFLDLSEPAAPPVPVDLRAQGPLIWNQRWGSCVAHAMLRCVNHAQRRQREPVLSGSPLFTYYAGRQIEGMTQEDSGLYVRDGAKAVAQYGMAPYNTFTNAHNFADRPSASVYRAALNERVVAYHRVLAPDHIHNALQAGLPVAFGMTLYESFLATGSDGLVPVPDLSESVLGGHSMTIEGYDAGTFIVANSWGTDWGDWGYCYIPVSMFDPVTGPLFNDLWVVDLTDKD